MRDYRAIVKRIKGPLVPITPAFTEDEALDLDSTCRWVNWIVESGIPLLWLTYGTSRYSSMTDEEVWDLTKAVAEVTRGRSLFIAATNFHWPAHQCRRYIEHAAACGADIVKVQVNWPANPTQDAAFGYYQAVAPDSPLPLFAYTLTPTGGSGLTCPLLERILDLPQYVGMKNDSGDFYEHRAYLRTIQKRGTEFAAMTGGSMMSFLWGYDFGAQAFTSGYGMVAPRIPLGFYQHLVSGRRNEAFALVRDYEEALISDLLDIGGWQALRAGLVSMGFFSSWRDRFPFRTLTASEAERVKAHLKEKGILS